MMRLILTILMVAGVPAYSQGFYGSPGSPGTAGTGGAASSGSASTTSDSGNSGSSGTAGSPSIVTVTETLRVTSTSDVWNTEVLQSTVVVTQLTTDRNYVAAQPATVTSVISVTARPVSVVKETVCINPQHTVVSYITSFVTVTETRELQNVVTHVDVFQIVETLPVSSVQTLVQQETSTTTVLTTATVTSTFFAGYGYQ